MIGSEIVGVAIGLSFTFLLLSIIASGLGEIVSRVFTLRAQTLRQGIRALVVGGEHGTATTFINDLFKRPAIRSLSRHQMELKYEEFGFFNFFRRQPGPSAIPAKRFVQALLSRALADEDFQKKLAKNRKERKKAEAADAGQGDGGEGNAGQSDKSKKSEMDLLVKHVTKNSPCEMPEEMASQIKQIATTVKLEVTEKDEQYLAFRNKLENWYDDSIERITGWYKRKLQVVLFILGLGLAIGLNVSAFTVGSALWSDDTVRAAVVVEAEAIRDAAADEEEGEDSAMDEEAFGSPTDVEAIVLLERLQLPIGWTTREDDRRVPSDLEGWIGHVVGWLFTAAAVSLGAPYWFDLMGKLIDLRNGGKDTSGDRQKEEDPEPQPDTEHKVTIEVKQAPAGDGN